MLNSMQKIKINIIGAGIVGKTIARLIHQSNIAEISSVVNTSLDNAKNSVDFIGAGIPITQIDDLCKADINIIATHENQIENICREAVDSKVFLKGSIVLHLSGALDSTVLLTAKNYGCHTARIHPIKHMHNPIEAVQTFREVYSVYQGDEECYETLKTIFEKIGSIIIKMQLGSSSDCYHTAGVFSLSYPQILVATASKLYESCGIKRQDALRLSIELAKSAVDSLKNKNEYHEFIEGPIKRLDSYYINKNKQSIQHDSDISMVYDSLALLGLAMTNHTDEMKDKVKILLTKNNSVDVC